MKIKTNPNKDFAQYMKKRIKENDGYCPCRLTKNESNKCMCKEFRDSISNGGFEMCHCGLYVAFDENSPEQTKLLNIFENLEPNVTAMFYISENLVEHSKGHYTDAQTIKNIRRILEKYAPLCSKMRFYELLFSRDNSNNRMIIKER